MRVLPKFKLARLEDSYPGSYCYYAVLIETKKFPWLEDKYFLALGDEKNLPEAEKRFDEFTTKWIREFVNPQEHRDLWAKVDADKVDDLISKMLGLTKEFSPKFEKVTKFDSYYKVDEFLLESDVNLAASNPIINSAWSSFKITTWSSWGKVDEKTGEISITFALNFRYVHQGGGSNGAQFCNVTVYEDRIELKDYKDTVVYKFDEVK